MCSGQARQMLMQGGISSVADGMARIRCCNHFFGVLPGAFATQSRRIQMSYARLRGSRGVRVNANTIVW